MKLSKKILDLVHDIQDLVMQLKDFHFYYQQNVQVFQVYRIEDNKHTFKESVYLDDETASYKLENIKMNLELILKNESLEGVKYEIL